MEHKTQDRELNLLDMFWHILLKWRPILLVAIGFAVLLAGYSYYSSMKQINSNAEAQVQEIVLQEADELMIARYLEYMLLYEKQFAYNEESPIMQLNPNGYYEGDIQYYVQVEGEITEATQNAIVRAYENVLSSPDFYHMMGEIVDDEIKESYYSEIVDYTNDIENVAYSVDVNNESKTENGMLEVTVRLQQQDQCEQVANLIKNEITKASAEIGNKVAQHSLKEVVSNVGFTSSETVFLYQKYNIEKSGSYNSVVAGLENQLTDKELAYAKQQLERKKGIVVEEKVEPVVDNQESTVVMKPEISIKMTILGLLLGGFLAVAWCAFLYLINGSLRLEKNFDKSYGVKLLGCIKTDKSNKKRLFGFVDKWLLRMRYNNIQAVNLEDAIPMIVTNIKIVCEKEGKKELTITKSGAAEVEKDVIKTIMARLSKEGIQAVEGNTILQDWAALESASKTSLLVLVESANKTSAFSMQREIEICKSQGIKVIGTVVVTE